MAGIDEPLHSLLQMGKGLTKSGQADAMLVLLDHPVDWGEMNRLVGNVPLLIGADASEVLVGIEEHEISHILLEMGATPVYEKLTQAILEFVADDLLEPGAAVVAIYDGFEPGDIDSMSLIRLDEHLGRLTVRDLRQLETRVPLDTLKTVVDLAVSIGREGREGQPVGTLFVVGDHRKTLTYCHPVGFDPVRGYNRKERNLNESRVREGIREIAVIDGAFIVSADGTVMAAAQFISAPAANVTLSKGLGTRHWAAAAITRITKAVAVTVSATNGTVRLFQNGSVVLRIEPFRRAMKWKDFEYEPPKADE